MKAPVLVIGGANMDILGMPGEHFAWRDSNIGRVTLSPGGVGRNIAQHIAQAGIPVELACVLGSDAFGQALVASCDGLGIGLRYALRADAASCVYMAIHDDGGDMAAAINDMRAMDLLDEQAIRTLPATGFSLCLLDANLSREALQAAANHMQVPLMADPVSCEKAPRLMPILNRLRAFKPNLMEAQCLTGCQSPQDAAAALLQMGVQQVFISLGREGLYCAAGDEHFHLPALPVPPGPATGAGDAMTAGLCCAIAQGFSLRDIAQQGLRFAHHHLVQRAAEAAK
jgi:pseudouridine kinase